VGLGKVVNLLDPIPLPLSLNKAKPFYQTLIQDIKTKIEKKPERHDFESLVQSKGITRSMLNEYMQVFTNPKMDINAKIKKAQTAIDTSNASVGFRRDFAKYSIEYYLESKKQINNHLKQYIEVINKIIDNLDDHEANTTIMDCHHLVYEKYKMTQHSKKMFEEEKYLKMIIFIELHE
jgi:hypothetical protein